MSRMLNIVGVICLAAVALTVVLPAPAQAQVVIVQPAQYVVPSPIVRTYSAYPGPTYVVPSSYSYSYGVPVTTYAVPRVSYYPAPVVTTYSPAPYVTTYSPAPAATVVGSPGVYTTYTYRNGLGIFRPRYVNQTYYTPLP